MERKVLGVLTAIHGRHELAKAMLRAVPSALPGWIVETFAVLGPDELAIFEEDFPDVRFSPAENSPLSRKFQTGVEVVHRFAGDRIDALCVMGSDDFCSIDYWLDGVRRLEEGAERPFGDRSCWMLDLSSGRMGRFIMGSPERPVGCGRFFPKDALRKTEWILWDSDMDRCIDGACEERLKQVGIRFDVVEMKGFMLDVKSRESLTQFDRFVNFMGAPFSRFDEILEPKEARELLRNHGLDAGVWSFVEQEKERADAVTV